MERVLPVQLAPFYLVQGVFLSQCRNFSRYTLQLKYMSGADPGFCLGGGNGCACAKILSRIPVFLATLCLFLLDFDKPHSMHNNKYTTQLIIEYVCCC